MKVKMWQVWWHPSIIPGHGKRRQEVGSSRSSSATQLSKADLGSVRPISKKSKQSENALCAYRTSVSELNASSVPGMKGALEALCPTHRRGIV